MEKEKGRNPLLPLRTYQHRGEDCMGVRGLPRYCSTLRGLEAKGLRGLGVRGLGV